MSDSIPCPIPLCEVSSASGKALPEYAGITIQLEKERTDFAEHIPAFQRLQPLLDGNCTCTRKLCEAMMERYPAKLDRKFHRPSLLQVVGSSKAIGLCRLWRREHERTWCWLMLVDRSSSKVMHQSLTDFDRAVIQSQRTCEDRRFRADKRAAGRLAVKCQAPPSKNWGFTSVNHCFRSHR